MTDAFNSGLPPRIAVLGAPIEIGASQRGTLMGPAALRTAGLLTLLDGLGFEVKDYGDLSIGDVADLVDAPPDNARHYREIQRWSRALSARACWSASAWKGAASAWRPAIVRQYPIDCMANICV